MNFLSSITSHFDWKHASVDSRTALSFSHCLFYVCISVNFLSFRENVHLNIGDKSYEFAFAAVVKSFIQFYREI